MNIWLIIFGAAIILMGLIVLLIVYKRKYISARPWLKWGLIVGVIVFFLNFVPIVNMFIFFIPMVIVGGLANVLFGNLHSKYDLIFVIITVLFTTIIGFLIGALIRVIIGYFIKKQNTPISKGWRIGLLVGVISGIFVWGVNLITGRGVVDSIFKFSTYSLPLGILIICILLGALIGWIIGKIRQRKNQLPQTLNNSPPLE